jgi:ABC-type lipopolysaccharide export system ATPase subunit
MPFKIFPNLFVSKEIRLLWETIKLLSIPVHEIQKGCQRMAKTRMKHLICDHNVAEVLWQTTGIG